MSENKANARRGLSQLPRIPTGMSDNKAKARRGLSQLSPIPEAPERITSAELAPSAVVRSAPGRQQFSPDATAAKAARTARDPVAAEDNSTGPGDDAKQRLIYALQKLDPENLKQICAAAGQRILCSVNSLASNILQRSKKVQDTQNYDKLFDTSWKATEYATVFLTLSGVLLFYSAAKVASRYVSLKKFMEALSRLAYYLGTLSVVKFVVRRILKLLLLPFQYSLVSALLAASLSVYFNKLR